MERYLGGDVQAASMTFSVLNEAGKRLRRDVVETNGRALLGYLKQQPGNLHLRIEEGAWSQWLYEILFPHVSEPRSEERVSRTGAERVPPTRRTFR